MWDTYLDLVHGCLTWTLRLTCIAAVMVAAGHPAAALRAAYTLVGALVPAQLIRPAATALADALTNLALYALRTWDRPAHNHLLKNGTIVRLLQQQAMRDKDRELLLVTQGNLARKARALRNGPSGTTGQPQDPAATHEDLFVTWCSLFPWPSCLTPSALRNKFAKEPIKTTPRPFEPNSVHATPAAPATATLTTIALHRLFWTLRAIASLAYDQVSKHLRGEDQTKAPSASLASSGTTTAWESWASAALMTAQQVIIILLALAICAYGIAFPNATPTTLAAALMTYGPTAMTTAGTILLPVVLRGGMQVGASTARALVGTITTRASWTAAAAQHAQHAACGPSRQSRRAHTRPRLGLGVGLRTGPAPFRDRVPWTVWMPIFLGYALLTFQGITAAGVTFPDRSGVNKLLGGVAQALYAGSAATTISGFLLVTLIASREPDINAKIGMLIQGGASTAHTAAILLTGPQICLYTGIINASDPGYLAPCLLNATANALGSTTQGMRASCAALFDNQLYSECILHPALAGRAALIDIVNGAVTSTNATHVAALALVTSAMYGRNLLIHDPIAKTLWTPVLYDPALPSIVIEHVKPGSPECPRGHFDISALSAADATSAALHHVQIPELRDYLQGAGKGGTDIICSSCTTHCNSALAACSTCGASLTGASQVPPARDLTKESSAILHTINLTAVANTGAGDCLPHVVEAITGTKAAAVRNNLASSLRSDHSLRSRVYGELDDNGRLKRIEEVSKPGAFLSDAELLALSQIYHFKFCVLSVNLNKRTITQHNIAVDSALRDIFPDGNATAERVARVPDDYHIIIHTVKVDDPGNGCSTPDHFELGQRTQPMATTTPHTAPSTQASMPSTGPQSTPATGAGTATTVRTYAAAAAATPQSNGSPDPAHALKCPAHGCVKNAVSATALRGHVNAAHQGAHGLTIPDSTQCGNCGKWYKRNSDGSAHSHACTHGTNLSTSTMNAPPSPAQPDPPTQEGGQVTTAPTILPPPPAAAPQPPPAPRAQQQRQQQQQNQQQQEPSSGAKRARLSNATTGTPALSPRQPASPPQHPAKTPAAAPGPPIDLNSIPLQFIKLDQWKRAIGRLFTAYKTADAPARNTILFAIIQRSRHNALPRNSTTAKHSKPRRQATAFELDQQCVEQALKELRGGSVGRANRALSSAGLLPIDDDLDAKLRTKYPDAPPDERLVAQTADASNVPALSEEAVRNFIFQKPATGGGGVDRWSWQDIQLVLRHDAKSRVNDGDVLGGLTAAINDIARGAFTRSPELYDALTACRGIPLRKPIAPHKRDPNKPFDDDVRPIGIGQIFLSTATALVIRSKEVQALIPEAVGPHQLCIGTAGGAEAAPDIIRAHIKLHPTHVAIKTDLKNAFNSLLRQCILDTAKWLPPLAPLINAIYSRPISVTYSGNGNTISINNTRGVTQGGSEGPLLFSTATRGAIDQVRARCPSVQVVAFADDVYILGGPTEALTAIGVYEDALLEMGLELQRAKSELWDPLQRPDVAASCTSARISWVDGFEAVGAPVGSPSFVAKHMHEAVGDMIAHVGRVTRTANAAAASACPQTAALFRLTRYCLAPAKINYFTRTNDVNLTGPYAKRYDDAVFEVLKAIIHAPHLSAGTHDGGTAMELAQLKATSGGLGLISAQKSAARSRFGSLLLTANIVARFLGDDFNQREQGQTALPELYALHELYRSDTEAGHKPRIEALDTPTDNLFSSQRKGITAALAKKYAEAERQRVLSQLPPTLAAWVRSSGGDGARFLRASGFTNSVKLTDAEFGALLRVRIGLPPSDLTPVSGKCKHCPGMASPLHSLHCGDMRKGGKKGQRPARHKMVKAAFITAVNAVATARGKPVFVQPAEPIYADVWEQKETPKPNPKGKPVRGDIATLTNSGNLRVGDFVVTHPTGAGKRFERATHADGVANNVAYKRKQDDVTKFYDLTGKGDRHKFYPIAYETGGRLHSTSEEYVATLVRDIINKPAPAWTPEDTAFYASSLNTILDATSVALAKSVACTLLFDKDPLAAAAAARDDAEYSDDDDSYDGDANEDYDMERGAAENDDSL